MPRRYVLRVPSVECPACGRVLRHTGVITVHMRSHRPFDVERFWIRIDRSGGPDACWPWARPHSTGYGQVWRAGRIQRAHRIAWELTVGPIPDGIEACHRCDNRACCNPAHLFLGTHLDNMRDMDAKGRRVTVALSGERHGMARLTADQARAIRERAMTGEHQARIARDFGVSDSTVSMIKTGRVWRSVAA